MRTFNFAVEIFWRGLRRRRVSLPWRIGPLVLMAALAGAILSQAPTSRAAGVPGLDLSGRLAGTAAEPLDGTEPLRMTGDIASNLVAGVDRFLLRKIGQAEAGRGRFWRRDFTSAGTYSKSIATNRETFAKILGISDARIHFSSLELVSALDQPARVGAGSNYQVLAVRWPAFGDAHSEGLLLEPKNAPIRAEAIAVPDADQTPEQICGLVPGVAPESQFARRLAEQGCRVFVPVLISRETGRPKTAELKRGQFLTNREFIYRSAYELGRTMVGYETEKILSLVDWLDRQRAASDSAPAPRRPIGIVGWGEGGLLALYAAALDPAIDAACVSGYFEPRNRIWNEPIDRNVFGLLEQFGDAEIGSMILPRALVIEAARGPQIDLPSNGGAPAQLRTPALEAVKREFAKLQTWARQIPGSPRVRLIVSGDGAGPYLTAATLDQFLEALGLAPIPAASEPPQFYAKNFDPESRQQRLLHELDRHNQYLLRESPYVRDQFMKRLDFSSLSHYAASAAAYRDYFYNEIIGHYSDPLLPPRPRSRKTYENPRWTGYEVALDVYPDVIAYGILLLPKEIKPGERRPVVVCQHGLEGRPQDVVEGDSPYYHAFAAKLADRGFITFAPQNLYIFHDRFRTLQRKSYPLKKTLFSIIIPQHQQIINWLKTLPEVDGERIAFYGLSYGGKTAMRVPAALTDYCLSICSGDFNEWVWKNASTRTPYSYVWGGEYEIFEWNLGGTFNYAEMSALIAPRPFMVERGHLDGVAPDETVAYEFAKTRFLYEARLHLKDQAEIEFFNGPHMIHGVGTFEFLSKHLRWPKE